MTWAEIEQLNRQVQQLPAARQQTSQQSSQVMVSAHSTMIGVLLPKGRFYTLSPLSKRVAQKPA